MRKEDEPGSHNEDVASIAKFINAVRNLPVNMTTLALESSENDDERAYCEPFAKQLEEQVTVICDHLTEGLKSASRSQQAEAAGLIALSAGHSLTERALDAGKLGGTAFGKMAMGDLFDLIKKIIGKVLEMLIKNDRIKKFIKDILEILNEIKDMLFGGTSPKMMQVLADRHVSYMAQLTQLEKLNQASAWRWQVRDEEEE